MPRYKRYAPLDHDINHDDEVWEFTGQFGDRSFRTLAQIFIIMDKTENRWRLVGDWSGSLSRTVRQSAANVRRQVRHMIAVGWLIVEEQAADGSPLVLSASNYWRYHRRQDPKKPDNETVKGPNQGTIKRPPNLTLPNHTYKDTEPATPVPSETKNGSEEHPPWGAPFKRLYGTDPVRFHRLSWFIHGALKKGYTAAQVARVLENFEAHDRPENPIKSWWPYLWKVLDIKTAKENAAEFEKDHAANKDAEAKWAKQALAL
jgi:hypothetical protein